MAVAQRVADTLKPYVGPQARARITRARFAARRPTAGLRCLPDFLLIGAMRSGTSSLFKYLAQHPELAPSLRKEVDYFARHPHRGEDWYRRHFALESRRRIAEARGRSLLSFEATPYYLYEPRTPARAAALLPQARLVVLLRDPVDRAFSDYQHMRRLGFEPLSFPDAVDAEEARLTPELARMAADPGYFSRDHHHFSYLARGRYADQLERWLAHYPAGRMLLLESRDLYRDPATCVRAVSDFLGVRPWTPQQFRNYSYVGRPPRRDVVDPGLRAQLRARFAESDQRLEQLWGHRPSWRDDA